MLLQRTLCVLAANACLGLLTAFHLAYLGLMFDSSSDQDQVCVSRIGTVIVSVVTSTGVPSCVTGDSCVLNGYIVYVGVTCNAVCVLQGYSMQHTLSKWSRLGYASHWVALATYLFYLLI